MVSRYNTELRVWEVGYWEDNIKFIVVDLVQAVVICQEIEMIAMDLLEEDVDLTVEPAQNMLAAIGIQCK